MDRDEAMKLLGGGERGVANFGGEKRPRRTACELHLSQIEKSWTH